MLPNGTEAHVEADGQAVPLNAMCTMWLPRRGTPH